MYVYVQTIEPLDATKAPSPPPPKPPPKPPVVKGPEFHTAVLKSKAFKEKERQKQREMEEAAASRKKERPSSSSSAREEQSSRDDNGEISRVCTWECSSDKIFIGTFRSLLASSIFLSLFPLTFLFFKLVTCGDIIGMLTR